MHVYSQSFFKRVYDQMLDRTSLGPVLSKVGALKLRKMTVKCQDIKDYVNLTFSFNLGPLTIKPNQIVGEITEFLKLLACIKPRALIEIGTALGGTLFLFSKVSSSDATIISIDLPGGEFGGGYPDWKTSLFRSFGWGCQRIHLICGDSHDTSTVFKVKKIRGMRKIDFLFIDGDHSYKGVKRDFEIYSPLVKNGGIVVFHDIVPGPLEKVGGVPRFWHEIRDKHECLEIVMNWNQGGYGIGLIYM